MHGRVTAIVVVVVVVVARFEVTDEVAGITNVRIEVTVTVGEKVVTDM